MSERLTEAELATLKTLCEGRKRFGIASAMVRVDVLARLLEEVEESRRKLASHHGGWGDTLVDSDRGSTCEDCK